MHLGSNIGWRLKLAKANESQMTLINPVRFDICGLNLLGSL